MRVVASLFDPAGPAGIGGSAVAEGDAGSVDEVIGGHAEGCGCGGGGQFFEVGRSLAGVVPGGVQGLLHPAAGPYQLQGRADAGVGHRSSQQIP